MSQFIPQDVTINNAMWKVSAQSGALCVILLFQ